MRGVIICTKQIQRQGKLQSMMIFKTDSNYKLVFSIKFSSHVNIHTCIHVNCIIYLLFMHMTFSAYQ